MNQESRALDTFMMVAVIAFLALAGVYWIRASFKKGFIEKRIQSWGKWYEGEEAERLGVLGICMGIGSLAAAVWWLVSWFGGHMSR
jgi:hypothetical protein